jgi:hypothetical protein
MVFEHLQDLFDLKDLANKIFQLFLVCFYVVARRIRGSIVMAFGVAKLLNVAKTFGGIRLIIIGKIFYQLVNRTLCFQFHDALAPHLSPHQFAIMIKGGCETMVHNI